MTDLRISSPLWLNQSDPSLTPSLSGGVPAAALPWRESTQSHLTMSHGATEDESKVVARQLALYALINGETKAEKVLEATHKSLVDEEACLAKERAKFNAREKEYTL